MSKTLTDSDCTHLYKSLKLSQQQVQKFEDNYEKVKGSIGKPEFLKIFSEYGFNDQLLEQHAKTLKDRLRKEEPVKVVKEEPVAKI